MNHALSDKEAALRSLGARRQQSRWDNYACIGDYHGGAYECDYVSPYTKSAGNIDAEIMILLQDWSSDSKLSQPLRPDVSELGHDPKLPTNRNLIRLLREHFGIELSETFATNLFPFIKRGSMSKRIPQDDLVRAAREFALPQIDIVQPRIVVCLGLQTFNAMCKACNLRPVKPLNVAIASPFDYASSRVWCQAHALVPIPVPDAA